LIDKNLVAEFWEKHARASQNSGRSGLANLETDSTLAEKKIEIERRQLELFIDSDLSGTFLDFGAGYGEWSLYFRKKFDRIIAYELSQTMCDIFREKIREQSINNIKVIQTDVSGIARVPPFRTALLSGILIYLSDNDVGKILSQLYQASQNNAAIILRDSTGLNGDFSIDGTFSDALNQNYYAFYRSREHYIRLFNEHGFYLVDDKDMFDVDSKLNKWNETRLRLYKFKCEDKVE
jgi:cyclopropane fatty-acyl-phospholipid synthase-like methyltransferase